MTTTTTTIADRIIDILFGGDGQAQSSRLGIPRELILNRLGRKVRPDGAPETRPDGVWRFDDESQIHMYGHGIDTPEGWKRNA